MSDSVPYVVKVIKNLKELAQKDSKSVKPIIGANISFGVLEIELTKAYDAGYNQCKKDMIR